MTTMKDIAKMANTSIGTVDRALNNKPGVSAKTRERIMAIAESLDYKPNRLGKALVLRNKNMQLGFIIEPITNPFFEELKRGAEQMRDALNEYGITTHIFCMNTHEEKEMVELLDRMSDMGVAGIALNAINSPVVIDKLVKLRESGHRIVTCSTDISRGYRDCFVGFCHEKSARVAAELLAKFTGRKGEFLVTIGYRYIMAHMQRLNGFESKIKEEYPGISLAGVLEVEENDEIAFRETLKALEGNDRINGIFIAGYGIKGVAKAVEVKNLGRDIKIICYDNSAFVTDYVKKGVIDAVICQDPEKQGYMALKILSDLIIGDKEVRSDTYTTSIDIRLCENIDKDIQDWDI